MGKKQQKSKAIALTFRPFLSGVVVNQKAFWASTSVFINYRVEGKRIK
jgi:hypothetical protein